MVAIDPDSGRWRTFYRGPTLGPGPVSPDGRYLVLNQA
jgi:hypothetical protein